MRRIYSLYSGKLLGAVLRCAALCAVSSKRTGASRNALWYAHVEDGFVEFIDLDEAVPTLRTLAFNGFTFCAADSDVVVFVNNCNPHDVLFYSLRYGWGARSRPPSIETLKFDRCVAHSYAFFVLYSDARGRRYMESDRVPTQVCVLILAANMTPPDALCCEPDAFPFIEMRLLRETAADLDRVIVAAGSNAHCPLIVLKSTTASNSVHEYYRL